MGFRRSALLLLLMGACTSSTKTPVQDPIELGRRLATDARDWRAHQDLARLRYDEGMWGASLREYLIVERQERLSDASRRVLGKLLVARAKERLQAEDPGALVDLQHAQRAGADAGAALPDALALAALADLRHSSAFTQRRAVDHLQVFARLVPGDPRNKQNALSELDQAGLLQVFHWFQKAGAKRQALRVAQHYVETGGRDPETLDQWLELHQWWYGPRRPPLPSSAAGLATAPMTALQRFSSAVVEDLTGKGRGAAQELAQDWKLEAWAADLSAIARAYAEAPARAETLARRFIDQPVYGARRLIVVAELFQRLGDSRRAKSLAIELAGLSTSMPSHELAAGLACVLDGDLGPGNQYFIRAAAASGDPGRYWAIAGKALRRSGYALESIAANRRALALTAPGRDLHILLELSLAQSALGRVEDAKTTQSTMLQRVPQASRPELASRIALAKQAESSRAAAFLDAVRSDLGF